MAKKATKKAEKKESQKVTDEKEEVKNKAEEQAETVEETADSDKEAEGKTDKQTSGQENDAKAEETNEVDETQQQIEAANASAKEWQDKYMRLSAEFDNYRKRTLKEKTDLTKSANADLLKDILPVIDDLERGIDNIGKSEDIEGLKKGIDLIYTKFVEFLRQNGVKEIDAKNKEFDLDFHEALTKIPAPSDDLKGKVVDVIEKGYLLNDKVIRYTKVVVGE